MSLQIIRNCLRALLERMSVNKICTDSTFKRLGIYKQFITNSSFFAYSYNIVLVSTVEYQLLKILQSTMLKTVV